MPDEAKPISGGRGADDLREVADALRNRVDVFGKTLAAIATLGTTAVGLTKVGDLFPYGDNGGWVVAACAGLAVAALAAIWVAVRLMKVARPVFMSIDLDGTRELRRKERKAVRPVYESAARRFGYTSLIGLQEHERSLRNAAARANDDAERARRTGLADEVKTEIEQALARGQVVVVRRRATGAVSGLSWLLYVAVIGGLLTFAAGTDKVASERSDPVAEAKACGEARKAGATDVELGRAQDICEGKAEPSPPAAPPPSAAEARVQVARKLMDALDACTALVQKPRAQGRPLAPAACKPVSDAVAAMNPR